MGWVTLLALITVFALLLTAFYQMTRVRPESREVEFLHRHNLHAVHVLRILESSDYQFYARRNADYRDFLFNSYAQSLEKDVAELGELKPGWLALIFSWLFRVVAGGLRLKRRYKSSIADLRLLLGLVLAQARHLSS